MLFVLGAELSFDCCSHSPSGCAVLLCTSWFAEMHGDLYVLGCGGILV